MLFSLTIVFLLRVRSRTLCAQWTCHVLWTQLLHIPVPPNHVPPARVLVCSHSRFTCFLTSTDVDCGLVDGHLFVFRFPLLSCWLVCAFPFSSRRFVICLLLPLTLYLLRTDDSSLVSLFLDSDSLLSHFPFLYLCTCISRTGIYTGWRCGLVPHLQSTLQPP